MAFRPPWMGVVSTIRYGAAMRRCIVLGFEREEGVIVMFNVYARALDPPQ